MINNRFARKVSLLGYLALLLLPASSFAQCPTRLSSSDLNAIRIREIRAGLQSIVIDESTIAQAGGIQAMMNQLRSQIEAFKGPLEQNRQSARQVSSNGSIPGPNPNDTSMLGALANAIAAEEDGIQATEALLRIAECWSRQPNINRLGSGSGTSPNSSYPGSPLGTIAPPTGNRSGQLPSDGSAYDRARQRYEPDAERERAGLLDRALAGYKPPTDYAESGTASSPGSRSKLQDPFATSSSESAGISKSAGTPANATGDDTATSAIGRFPFEFAMMRTYGPPITAGGFGMPQGFLKRVTGELRYTGNASEVAITLDDMDNN